MTEAQLCQFFGWSFGSKTPRIYVHLSGRDLNDVMERVGRIENEKFSGFAKHDKWLN
jgi:hypothetical protein